MGWALPLVIVCQFSESFRQWFFRIIPPLAGAASFSAYAMVSTLSKSFSA